MVNFTKIELKNFLSKIDNFSVKGKLSGTIDLGKKEKKYYSDVALYIENLYVNNIEQGNLMLKAIGQNSYKKYITNLSLQNKPYKKHYRKRVTRFFKRKSINGYVCFFRKN